MSAIKEFFKKKKSDLKFKTAGPGQRLSESTSNSKSSSSQPVTSQPLRHQPSEGAQRAGAAALARIEQAQSSTVNWSAHATKTQAKKEIELEDSLKSNQASAAKIDIVDEFKDMATQDVFPSLAVSGVYFHCPVVGPDILPISDIKAKIRQFLYDQMNEEPGLTACVMIHTLNPKDRVSVGVETLARYLTNILDNPSEDKFRKIRFNNKIFQDRISGLEGAFNFLGAAGFVKKEEGGETYFVLDDAHMDDLENMQMLKEALLSAEPILPILDRNVRVLKPTQATTQIDLPDDFFSLSKEEMKREQKLKREAVELLTQLRTKAMRERDEIRQLHIYKYSLVRIRFPDGIILQGTFYVYERLTAVKEFVAEHLSDPSREFQLSLSSDSLAEDGSLLELKLVPAVIFNFSWLSGAPDQKMEYLKPETKALLSDL